MVMGPLPPAYGSGYGTGYGYAPAYGYGYGTGYTYAPAYGYGYGTGYGYGYPAYGSGYGTRLQLLRLSGVTGTPITPLSDAISMPLLLVSIVIVIRTNAGRVRLLDRT